MKIIEIDTRKNVCTATFEVLIVLFGKIKIRKTLYQEQVIFEEFPFWYKSSKWLLQKTCKHKYKKQGGEYLEGYLLGDVNTFLQNWNCGSCGKTTISKRQSGSY